MRLAYRANLANACLDKDRGEASICAIGRADGYVWQYMDLGGKRYWLRRVGKTGHCLLL